MSANPNLPIEIPAPIKNPPGSEFVGLFCDLSHLGPYSTKKQAGDPYEYFCCLISPASAKHDQAGGKVIFHGDEVTISDPTDGWFVPWSGKWRNDESTPAISGISLAMLDRTGGSSASWEEISDSVEIIPHDPSYDAAGVSLLSDYFAEVAGSSVGAGGLRNSLLNWGTSVFPYNYPLNLACCFRVRRDKLPNPSTDTDEIYLCAAPHFQTRQPTSASAGFSALDQSPPAFTWEYQRNDASDPIVLACGGTQFLRGRTSQADDLPIWSSIPAVDGDSKALIDIDRGWVRVGNKGSWAIGTNWLEQLDDRIAHLFDAPQLLVDSLREVVEEQLKSWSDGKPAEETLRWLLEKPAGQNEPPPKLAQDWLFALSFDLVLPGAGSQEPWMPLPPDDQNLVGALAQSPQDEKVAVDSVKSRRPAKPAEWLEWLSPSADIRKDLLPDERKVAEQFEPYRDRPDIPDIEFAGGVPSNGSQYRNALKALSEVIQSWDSFLGTLRDSENMRVIVFRLWRDPFQDATKDADFNKKLWDLLDQTSDPARWMGRHLAGLWWTGIVDDAKEGQSGISWNLKNDYLIPRMTNSTTVKGFEFLPSAPDISSSGLPEKVFTRFKEESIKLFRYLKLPRPEAPTPESLPIRIQVDQVGEYEESKKHSDLLQDIAGFEILLAVSGGNLDWRSLNKGAYLKKAGDPTITEVSSKPARPSYTNRTRTSFFPYDGQPITARSPGQTIFEGVLRGASGSAGDNGVKPPDFVIPRRANEKGKFDQCRIHGLGFGQDYFATAAVIFNGGSLPPQISSYDPVAETGHPAWPSSSIDLASLASDFQASIPYRRTTAIGSPLFYYGQTAGKQDQSRIDSMPKIPDKVCPMAYELIDKPNGGGSGQFRDKPALLMLFHDSDDKDKRPQQVTHRSYLPSTDLTTWDRHMAAKQHVESDATKKEKIRLKRRDALKIFALSTKGGLAGKIKRFPDDPAVDTRLYFALETVWTPGTINTPAEVVVGTREKLEIIGQEVFEDFLRGGVDYTVSCGKPGGASMTTGANGIEITLPPGSVWRLKIFPLISRTTIKEDFDSLFDPDVGGSWAEKQKDENEKNWIEWKDPQDGKEYIGCSPREVMIEIATPEMPDPARLREALVLSPLSQASRIAIDRRGVEKIAYVSEVQLQTRSWFWSGQPVRWLDFNEIRAKDDPDENKKLLEWETEGFRTLDDTVFHETKHRLPFALDGSEEFTLVSLPPGPDESGEKGSFVQVSGAFRSRYASAYADESRHSEKLVIQACKSCHGDNENHKEEHDIWRRMYLPPQFSRPLPKPKIRMILPLTRSAQTGLSLLVVIDEAFYSFAGPAERIEAEVQTVADPKSDGNDTYLEAGFDPLLSTRAMGTLENHPQAHLNAVRPTEPIGLTFDVSAKNPGVRRSCFELVLNTDEISKIGGVNTDEDFGWFLMKLRFRRTLAKGSMEAFPRLKDMGEGDERAERKASDWTASEWVQFVPDGGLLIDSDLEGKTVPIKIDGEKSSGEIPRKGFKFDCDFADEGGRAYAFLVTRKVTDTAGVGREIYAASLAITKSESSRFVVSSNDGEVIELNPAHKHRIRVLEFRVSNMKTASEKLRSESWWSLIVGKDEKDESKIREDAHAQLVRVSNPIDLNIT